MRERDSVATGFELMFQYTDETNIEAESEYKCSSCGQVSPGKQLLPVFRERLKEDPVTHEIQRTGEWVCSVRRCPYCRGGVKKV